MTLPAPVAPDDIPGVPIHGSSVVLPLPPRPLRFMGEDDAELVAIGRGLAGLLTEFGLTDSSSVLDIGSGYGRLAIGILASRPYRGTYLGFDILRRHVRWCRTSITPLAPNVRFELLDIRNDRYNPAGRLQPASARFPAGSASIDVCAATSVFTHIDRATTEHYLAEVHRVLRPGAVAVTTWLLYDDARLDAVTSGRSKFPMRTRLGEVNRIAFPDEPLKAIAYDEAYVRRAAAAARLTVVRVEHGKWDGDETARTTQDLVVFRRDDASSRRDAIGDGVVALLRWPRRAIARLRRRARR